MTVQSGKRFSNARQRLHLRESDLVLDGSGESNLSADFVQLAIKRLISPFQLELRLPWASFMKALSFSDCQRFRGVAGQVLHHRRRLPECDYRVLRIAGRLGLEELLQSHRARSCRLAKSAWIVSIQIRNVCRMAGGAGLAAPDFGCPAVCGAADFASTSSVITPEVSTRERSNHLLCSVFHNSEVSLPESGDMMAVFIENHYRHHHLPHVHSDLGHLVGELWSVPRNA